MKAYIQEIVQQFENLHVLDQVPNDNSETMLLAFAPWNNTLPIFSFVTIKAQIFDASP